MKKSIIQFNSFSKEEIRKIKGGQKDKSPKMKINETAALVSGATYCPPPEPDDE